MARFVGHAIGRTLAETVQRGSEHVSGKEMPKANVPARGKRFSQRRPEKGPAESEEAKTDSAVENPTE